MDRAWDQVGDIIEANRKLCRATFSLAVSNLLYERYFQSLPDLSFLSLTSFIHSRRRLGDLTIDKRLQNSQFPAQFFNQSFAKFASPTRNLLKRFSTNLNTNIIDQVLNGENLQQVVTIDHQSTGINFNLNNLGQAIGGLEELDPVTVPVTDILRRGSILRGIDIRNYFPNLNIPISPGLSDTSSVNASADDDNSSPVLNALTGYTTYMVADNWQTELMTEAINVTDARTVIHQAALPGNSIPPSVWSEITWINNNDTSRVTCILAYPTFPEPMYLQLLEKDSAERFLPNIEKIPRNTIALLETNRGFIESYMVGLNHEMSRELIWREYPTDRRGSYFRQFWEVIDNSNIPPEATFDINEIHTWGDNELGINDPRNVDPPQDDEEINNLVLVIRGELLKKFPNTLIYMVRGKFEPEENAADPGSRIRILADETEANIKMPIFKANVNPDITFIGFDITDQEAAGDLAEDGTDDAGWFFIIKERPGEIRFGLDIDSDEVPDTFAEIAEWDDLSWNHLTTQDGEYINILDLPEESRVIGQPVPATEDPSDPNDPEIGSIDPGDNTELIWRKNAAHMAGILFQLPYMIAIHARVMLA